MTDRKPLRGDALADALAEAFDSVAPTDRTAAETELRETGADPRRVGQRTRAAAGGHSAQVAQRIEHRPVVASLWHSPLLRLAAGVVLAIGVAWWAMRASPAERIATRQPAPQARTLPPRLVQAAPGEAVGRDAGQRAIADAHATNSPVPVDMPVAFEANVTANDAYPLYAENGDADAAESGPRWLLHGESLGRAKGVLPGSVQGWVARGEISFPIIPTAAEALHDNYPAAFWSATARNRDRFFVDPVTCALGEASALGGAGTLRGTPPVTGLPFPTIAADDAAAPCEIMWNVEAAAALSGPRSATWTLDRLPRQGKPLTLTLSMQSMPALAAHFAQGDDEMRAARRVLVVAPADLRGDATLTLRPADAERRDVIWNYVDALRRVRRVQPANRGDGMFGAVVAPDDIDCFDARLEDFTWTVGRRADVLAPMLSAVPLPLEQRSEARARWRCPSQPPASNAATRRRARRGQSTAWY